ncbi:hypothetical protein PCL_08197 [Purpureocillium lilacinum]|uniref:Uncharacterized protein n=1 Tax=Purpureocillium lilacinum TaxID=33203 RepID=A0A2U3EK60_PURLI|nr:hypothetical protein PCL_08197 [Purpureocillium lilacinum]
MDGWMGCRAGVTSDEDTQCLQKPFVVVVVAAVVVTACACMYTRMGEENPRARFVDGGRSGHHACFVLLRSGTGIGSSPPFTIVRRTGAAHWDDGARPGLPPLCAAAALRDIHCCAAAGWHSRRRGGPRGSGQQEPRGFASSQERVVEGTCRSPPEPAAARTDRPPISATSTSADLNLLFSLALSLPHHPPPSIAAPDDTSRRDPNAAAAATPRHRLLRESAATWRVAASARPSQLDLYADRHRARAAHERHTSRRAMV